MKATGMFYLQQIDKTSNVVLVVFERNLDGFTDSLQGCEVNDEVEFELKCKKERH